MYVLGIDAGGTKTLCLLADAGGHVLESARGDGANLHTAGEREVEHLIGHLVWQVTRGRTVEVDAICVGMAGVDRAPEIATVTAMLSRICPAARPLVVNDALIALVAGAGDEPGIVVVSGTGSIAYGRNARHEAARSGGWGYVLGDEGSGYWIGRHMLRAVVRQADGRDAPTVLTALILAHFGLSKPEDLVVEIAQRPVRPARIAALAAYVQRGLDLADPVATRIVERAADELALSAVAVARRLGLLRERFPFILAGTVFREGTGLTHALSQRLLSAAPGSEVRRLEEEPATGAVRLALAELRGGVTLPAYLPW